MGKLVFILMLAGFAFYAADGFGMDSKQRLAIIKGLKIKGIVGENNKGLLEFRTADKSAAAVVDEENAERTKAYSEIAKKTKVEVADVGAQRAAQIAKEESAGVWLQDAEGKWKKK
ncbi:MAG: hypothetical protein A2X48_15910 [Lentisphaerae bacterium GWF2_49_21]|nr:MAG: hypothetical protein A2X48_15910 [Lentisphaerae bacterium GWF2_49_21]